MATTGKAGPSKSVKIASLVLLVVLVVEVGMEEVVSAAAEDLVAEEAALVAGEATEAATAVAEVDLVEVSVEAQVLVLEEEDLRLLLMLLQILSPTSPPRVENEVPSSTSEMFVPLVRMRPCKANIFQLPWSTSNEDLVELFTTIGKVERAEIQYEPNGRSRGTGVVEFDSAENAETAISQSPILDLSSYLI
jgi:hypothetical protein